MEHGRLVVVGILNRSTLGILERASQTANIVHLLGRVAAIAALLFVGLHGDEFVLIVRRSVVAHVVLLLLLVALTIIIVAHGASRANSRARAPISRGSPYWHRDTAWNLLAIIDRAGVALAAVSIRHPIV